MNDRAPAPQIAVARFIEKAAGAKAVHVQRWERMPGGAIQQNFALDAVVEGGPHEGSHRWVVRCDAPSAVAASHSRAHEFAILSAAHAARVRSPRPLWLSGADAGPSFFVMEHVAGTAAGHRLVKDDALVPDRARLACELGENLARLHFVKPPVAGLEFLGAPPEHPARERVAHYRAALDALGEAGALPVAERALRWCERNLPPAARAVLVHRDYRTGNYLVHEGRLAAVLDWEFAGWGDALEDLGWFLARCWRFGRADREAGGIASAHDFLAGYHRISGRSVTYEETRFWQVMAHVRWAVIAVQQAERHRAQGETSLELALTAHVVPQLEWEILSLIGARA
jgi:aminoglycoside phosphotransferase (APT) family kinase protein